VWLFIHTLIEGVSKMCYNTLLREHKMDLHKQLTQLLLQVQNLLEEDYAEHPAIQDAFNALVCAIDDEML
jgi:Holliday junction resolvasome RuvABC endonuclease subunit